MIRWRDMLAWPFERANCYDLACEVARRAGLAFPTIEAWDSAASDLEPAFVRVAYPDQIADIIASDPEEKGYASHVAAVVAKGWALSTSRAHGPYCWPIMRHACDRGFWRLKR